MEPQLKSNLVHFRLKIMTSDGNNFNNFSENQSIGQISCIRLLFIVWADLPENCSISVPAVINNIYRKAVPAQKYLPEQCSAAFRHHYTPGCRNSSYQNSGLYPSVQWLTCTHCHQPSGWINFCGPNTQWLSSFGWVFSNPHFLIWTSLRTESYKIHD